MKVGIDARALTGRYTGDRTYWLNLIRAYLSRECGSAENEYFLYSRLPIPQGLLPECRQIHHRLVPASNDRLWTMLAFPRALRQDSVDVAHTQYTTPLQSPCPMVTTVHDISFRLYPEWFPRKHRLLLNLMVPASMRRAHAVITDSDSSRRDILRIYRLSQHKIVSIHLAAGPEYLPTDKGEAQNLVRDRFGISEPFVLAVGVLQPRKNLPLLLEGFARFKRGCDLPHKLVITGKRGWGNDDLARLAARLNVNQYVHFTDYVADEDLPILYSAADILGYPSLYEGFGLPPLEAMACGCAVFVSDAPAMPEIAGDGALVLPVMDAARWGEAMCSVLGCPEKLADLSARGLRRAKCFSWTRTASDTLAIYRDVVETSIPVAANFVKP